jgi:transcriptional regulator with XRE-family HTH domain
MAIGKRLSDLLEARKENVNSISSQISVSPQTIYSIIKRDNMKVDFEVLMKLAKALNVSVEYFYEPASIESTASQSPLFEKISRLDNGDLDKAEAYIDGLLSQDKYNEEAAARAKMA